MEELTDFIQANPDPRELKRALAVQMVMQNYTHSQIAHILHGRASGKCGMEYYTREENKLCSRKLCPAYFAVMKRPINTEKRHGSNAGNTMRATFGEKATTSQGDLR